MTLNNHKTILEPLRFVEYALGDSISRLKNHHTVLFCFDAGIYGKLKKMFRGSIFSGLAGELYLMDDKIALAGKFGIGCPATVTLLEELVACGIRRFVGIGPAGALRMKFYTNQHKYYCGSDLHTSKMFSKPSLTLSAQLALCLKKHHVPFVKGKAWTTDAPFRETKQNLEYFLNAGAAVVEMEASAMFNVARFRKVSVANVFVVGDSISGGIWNPMFRSNVIKQKSLLTAREIVLFLSENPTSSNYIGKRMKPLE